MEHLYFGGQSKEESRKRIICVSIAAVGIVCLIGAIALTSNSHGSVALQQFQLEEEEFKTFMSTHNKFYETEEEYTHRFQIFRENSAFIRLHNSMNENWFLGINQFADLTADEFTSLYHRPMGTNERARKVKESQLNDIPAKIDWRTKGAVGPVKMQWLCWSCWAFSVTGAIESAWYIAHNVSLNLSEQELVDCSTSYGNNGCDGGEMDFAFKFVIDHGITSQSNYPYVAKDGTCKQDKVANVTATISSYVDVPANSSSALIAAISQQPVSVGIEANQWSFRFYRGGIIDKNCGTFITHAVLAVGYDTTFSTPYYTIKNCWSTVWGENGYARIAITEGEGICGIQMQASYPIVN